MTLDNLPNNKDKPDTRLSNGMGYIIPVTLIIL